MEKFLLDAKGKVFFPVLIPDLLSDISFFLPPPPLNFPFSFQILTRVTLQQCVASIVFQLEISNTEFARCQAMSEI